jgi:hypothetical protein
MIMLRYFRILALMFLFVAPLLSGKTVKGQIEHKSIPCTLFDKGSNEAVVEFYGAVESDGVHSVIIIPESCPGIALNLKIEPGLKHTSWWKRFSSTLSSGHPGTVDKKITALFKGVIVRSADPRGLNIELRRISEIRTLPSPK